MHQHIKYIWLLLFLERSAHTARIRSLKVDASLFQKCTAVQAFTSCTDGHVTLVRCTVRYATLLRNVQVYSQHFCAAYIWTPKKYILEHPSSVECYIQEEYSCALQRGKVNFGKSLSKLYNHKIHSQYTGMMATWKLFVM